MARSCRFHCAGCDRHFSSLSTFDRHRVGPFSGERVCMDPATEPEVFVSAEGGICKISGDGRRDGQTIYSRHISPAAKARLAALSGRASTG